MSIAEQGLHASTATACENGQRALQNLLVIVARECCRGIYDDELRQAVKARAALIAAADHESQLALDMHNARRRVMRATGATTLSAIDHLPTPMKETA